MFVRWSDVASPYGPLFTIAGDPLAYVSVPAALWVYKALAATAGLGCVALIWRIAARIGQDPRRAAVFVGLNPLVVVYGVGGAHNDLLVELLVLAGIASVLARRDMTAGAQIALAMALKAPTALVLAFAYTGAGRRRRLVAGTVAGMIAVAVLAVVGAPRCSGSSRRSSTSSGSWPISASPNQLGVLLGFGAITSMLCVAGTAAFAGVAVWSFIRAWRGEDWIVCAGWTTFAALVTSAWPTPWYVVWVLPLAAIGSSRHLRVASLIFCGYLVVTRTVPHLA